MDIFNKFIIETIDGVDCLIIAKCTYHKQLADVFENVKGGGSWDFSENNSIVLYGESESFGKAKFEDILNCIKNKQVYHDSMLIRNVSDKYTFQYKDVWNNLTDLI